MHQESISGQLVLVSFGGDCIPMQFKHEAVFNIGRNKAAEVSRRQFPVMQWPKLRCSTRGKLQQKTCMLLAPFRECKDHNYCCYFNSL
jgi:hypothetical protein